MEKIGIFTALLVGLQCFAWSAASAGNRVDILLEGYVVPIEGRELIPGVDEENGGRFVASTIALVKGVGVNVIVDPGFVGDRQDLLSALDRADVEPEDVTHVFISHHHPDHTINAALFPNATVVDFWATYKGDLWEDHRDNFKIAPGIKVRRTPGHTSEDASLIVKTKHGKVVFTHVWWLLAEGDDGPVLFPPADPIAEDPEALEDSREFVFDIADCIVPGHGSAFPNPHKPNAVCVFNEDDE